MAMIALAGVARAAPHKILVLPLDGNADPALRAQLDAQVVALAHHLDGEVAPGNATFAESATAIGCDPADARCVDQVLDTLVVDEIVWGTATTTAGATTLVVRRSSRGSPWHGMQLAIAATDPVETTGAKLGPLFGQPARAAAAGDATVEPAIDRARPDRTRGIAFAAGGGLALVVGLALWANASSLQGDIDAAPNRSLADARNLQTLEAKADAYALAGNLAVLVGLVAGGVGGYYLWRDQRGQRTTIAPAVIDHGAGLALGGRW